MVRKRQTTPKTRRGKTKMTPAGVAELTGVIMKDIFLVCVGLFVGYKIYKKIKKKKKQKEV